VGGRLRARVARDGVTRHGAGVDAPATESTMAKKDAAKRAAKKHEKEKKRKKKLDARPPRVVKQDPVDGWKPAIEGIEGLAHRLEVGSHDAAHLADLVATHGRRKDAAVTWLPSKVRALTDAQILAELAARGVVTDESTFVAAAEAREGARDLAIELWKPMMRATASVHDRDFVGESAVVLWERWAPHHLADEVLHDLLREAFDHIEDDKHDAALGVLCHVWELARENGGLDRIARADGRGDSFLEALLGSVDDLGPAEPKLHERALATLHEIREVLPADHDAFVHTLVNEARTLETLGRAKDGIELLLAAAPAWPEDPDVLGEAAEMFMVNPKVGKRYGDDVAEALTAARNAAAVDKLRAIYEEDLTRLNAALAAL